MNSRFCPLIHALIEQLKEVGLTDRERAAFPIYTYFPMQHVDVADS